MAVKRGIIVAVCFSTVLLLSGCVDKMPDMTQEENDLVAEYAASILLKHSNSYNYRLVDERELERSLFEDNQAALAAIEEVKKQEMEQNQTDEESNNPDENQDTQDNNSEKPLDDKNEQESGETTDVDNSETINVETTVQEQYATDVDIASLIGVDDTYSISFLDYEITDSYPQGRENEGFQLSASRGNKLVVLRFSVENKTSEKVNCDMFDINPKVSIDINESGYQSIESTLLLNDFMTYIGDIGANQTIDLVAIYEMKGEEIDSMMLQIGQGSSKQELIVE